MRDIFPSRRPSIETLVGCKDELERLKVFLTKSAIRSSVLLLSGEAGVGKTALLDAAEDIATTSGRAVLRADCVDFEADIPFSALNQLLVPLHGALDRLARPDGTALMVALGFEDGSAPDRRLVADAAFALLREAAAVRPVLLIVDDLQWLDRSSAAVLSLLARDLAQSQVGLLGAFRSDTETLFDSRGLTVHQLRPLSEEAAASLVGTRFPELGARALHSVLTEAEGNPLALLELPTALSWPELASLRGLPQVLPLTERLRGLFASQVDALPASTRELLLLAALGRTGDLNVLRGGASRDSVFAELVPAQLSRLVSVKKRAGQLIFRHPMVRSTVVEVSTAVERRRAHRRLAEVLVDQPDRRAWHLAEATTTPDEDVAELLEKAANHKLRRGDAVGAVVAMARAADLTPKAAERARRLAVAAYVGADVTGELRKGTELLSDTSRAGQSAQGSLEAAVVSAFLELNGHGNVDRAHRLLVTAIEAHAGDGEGHDLVFIEALHNLLEVCLYGARPELWKPFHANVIRLAPEAAPDLALWTNLLADPARTAAGWTDRLDLAIRGLPEEMDPTRIERVAAAGSFVDRVSDCREPLWRVVRDGRGGGAVASAVNALMLLCIDDFKIGRWDEARGLADEGIQLCESLGYRLLTWPFQLAKALLAAAQGDSRSLSTLTDSMDQWEAPRGAGAVQGYACHARALAAIGRGDFEEAYQQAAAISPAGALAAHVGRALWVALDLVESAVHTNRREEAAAHVVAMREARIADLSPRLALVVAGSAAMAATDERFAGLFEVALALPQVDRWPFDLARVQLAYGERLRRSHETTYARVRISAAFEGFERLNARPWAARAQTELLATGLTKLSATEFGSASLTPQERHIAALAATGLTNKQIAQRMFISPRTVGAHLRQVFSKLGVASRAAIGNALATRDDPEPLGGLDP